MRRVFKALVFAVAWVLVLPLIVLVWLEKRLTRSEELFLLCNQIMATGPGFVGRWLRAAYYCGTLDACSWEVHIGFGSLFSHRGARIGSRVSTGSYCVLGHVTVEADVRMASRVSVPSGRRQHFDAEGQLATVTHFERVRIGGGSWIGEGAIVLADVGAHCIVAAGAVVTRPVTDGVTVAGNPARPLAAVNPEAAS
jgi:acetyltransferase-like isoleucine patch superfamily enzyme